MAGISAPDRSVPVSRLVNIHKPKSARELEQLIADHIVGGCSCGIVSQGTIGDFGRNLYEAQKEYWGEYRFSLRDCIQWEYDLFVLQSLKGSTMEDKCKESLQKLLGTEFIVKKSDRCIDEELRVDLEIEKDKRDILGIQVKPKSFSHVRQNIQAFNREANKKYGRPVLYIFYDYETGGLLDLENVASRITNLS
jgi:hypothetical protein